MSPVILARSSLGRGRRTIELFALVAVAHR
jgi:hypothetical protein